MRRAALLTFALALVAAGCGGVESVETTAPVTTAPPVTTTSGDPGRDAIEAFAAAARANDAAALWSMLSTSAQQRLGPAPAAFRFGAARGLTASVGAFGTYRVIVSERVTPEFGVVAIDGTQVVGGKLEESVYAVALRLEGTAWKIELGGPVKIRPLGPDPGARKQVVTQIADAVERPAGAGTAVTYLDGKALSPRVTGPSSSSRMVADVGAGLDPGRHTVVAFAATDRDASATAWAFTVAK